MLTEDERNAIRKRCDANEITTPCVRDLLDTCDELVGLGHGRLRLVPIPALGQGHKLSDPVHDLFIKVV